MATIVVMTVPAHGHINPTLAVIAELKKRGHRILYYNTESFRPQIEGAGAEFRSYPAGVLAADDFSKLAQGNLINVTLLLLRTTETILPFMLDELSREKPDLVIYDSTAMWGYLAAKILHIPSVASITTFVLAGLESLFSRREFASLILNSLSRMPELIKVRSRLTKRYPGLLPKKLFPVTGDLSLVFTSRDVQPETPFINETFKFVGPSINHENRAKNEEFPFEQIKRKPVIYISLGTVNNRDLSFYRRCFQAFAEFPGQFILSVGQSTDLAQLGPIPENFIVRNSVPQLELLQQVDLFISHAGMNSLHESLYYGVPLVMIPQHMEQLANARIAALRGVGIVLGGMGAYGKVSVADLREAVNTVLGQSRFRQMAQSISQSLQAAGGYLQAANEIEILAARKIITQGNEKFAVTLDAKPDDAVLATDGPGSLYSQ